MTKTYDPRLVTMSFGSHIVTGFADDSIITIEASGDGITKKVGCDGEIARAVSPDDTAKVKIVLLQTSDSNAYFSKKVDQDRDTGDGMFPILIKDLKGGEVFSTEAAWVVKKSPLNRGKDTNNREWELDTGSATLTE